jgi:hypothetical protein
MPQQQKELSTLVHQNFVVSRTPLFFVMQILKVNVLFYSYFFYSLTFEQDEEEEEHFDSGMIFAHLGVDWQSLLVNINSNAIFRFNGVAWSSKEQLALASLYPEVIEIDTTCKTNTFNHPLCFLVGVDGERKSFVWLSAILPFQKRTTFLWLLEEIVPLFVGTQVLSAITVFLSDGDRQIIDAITAVITSKLYGEGKTTHLLCYWHTVTKVVNEKLSFLDDMVAKTLKAFLYRIAKYCESYSSFTTQWNLLLEYCEKNVSDKSHLNSIFQV